MKNNQKGFAPVILLLAGFVLVFAAWFAWQNFSAKPEIKPGLEATSSAPLAPATTTNDNSAQESAIAPKQLAREFDSGAIFGDKWNNAASLEMRKCMGDSALECQATALKNLGASDAAVEFYRQSDWGMMANYTGYGDAAAGYYALLDVFSPLAANSDHQYAFLAGKNLWYLMNTDFKKVVGGDLLAKNFPSDKEVSFSNSEFVGLNKKGEVVFTFEVTGGCRACGTGYRAVIGYKTDVQKSAVYASLSGFCAESQITDNKYPSCSSSDILNY